jgi:nucleotide-binding universal stress UspA family protein
LYETIVVGTDGSPTATLAVERAASLAAALGAKLMIVSAYEPGFVPLKRPRRLGDRDGSARRVSPQQNAEGTLAAARKVCEAAGVRDVAARSVNADPAIAILDVALEVEAGLIVVGNVGVSGARRLLLGSVPNRILQRAPCDVIVARTRDGASASPK